MQVADFCREIESYLCRKNDGHLIRVTGPSFDLVAGWARLGVPIKVAFRGIDRHFERYYRRGPRRRPVKIDFCEADVLDAFDEWRRATGITVSDLRTSYGESPDSGPDAAAASSEAPRTEKSGSRGPNSGTRHLSLPEHLKRVLLRLTSARAGGSLGAAFDALLDRVSTELDHAQSARPLRGATRQAMIDRLEALDRELLQQARTLVDEAAGRALSLEADEALAPFRAGMSPDAFARAREAAIDRLVRERYNLPVVSFSYD